MFGSIGFLCTAATKPYLASPIPRSTRRSSSSRSRCIEISNYTLAVSKWRTATYLRFAPARRRTIGCRWGSIFLTHEDIAAAGEAIVARELTAPPVTHRIKPPRAALNRLLNLHEAAGHLAKTAADILVKPE